MITLAIDGFFKKVNIFNIGNIEKIGFALNDINEDKDIELLYKRVKDLVEDISQKEGALSSLDLFDIDEENSITLFNEEEKIEVDIDSININSKEYSSYFDIINLAKDRDIVYVELIDQEGSVELEADFDGELDPSKLFLETIGCTQEDLLSKSYLEELCYLADLNSIKYEDEEFEISEFNLKDKRREIFIYLKRDNILELLLQKGENPTLHLDLDDLDSYIE
ncbi:MAG: hypothetical protein GXO02_05970 [Epsilonproteobacteria bacterium]|nr:hypothetical protein [Campylobacterota bacterium]